LFVESQRAQRLDIPLLQRREYGTCEAFSGAVRTLKRRWGGRASDKRRAQEEEGGEETHRAECT
jgi:hypothetical protein